MTPPQLLARAGQNNGTPTPQWVIAADGTVCYPQASFYDDILTPEDTREMIRKFLAANPPANTADCAGKEGE